MTWNYRIVSEVVGDYTEYFVAEVYYDGEGNPKSWTDREEFNALRAWDNAEDLRGTVRKIHEALDKPVLRVMGVALVEQR